MTGTLIHYVTQSADGFIEGPNGEFDWTVMDPELSAYSHELTDHADAFLYGRKVWDMMSSYWPHAEEHSDHAHDLAFAAVWREMPKIVVSRTLEKADWNTRVINDNVADEIRAIKAAGTNLLLTGGSSLAGHLTEHGLIDEYRITVHPTVLGGGKPVFQDPERFKLRLIESRIFDSQVVLLRYAPTT
ncbi:dihydrofolate reductase family protein [Streptomyces sp. A7024]|uniref:Dihydrofolate reductase family protein n=1 Tax=Streptomyces coryli TaxID=1128680 RepID=A0A6G4U132_9ACTN|nr:dihydrofolate reductase family protein [Streptomyces coryli]NGN65702.1 dihydrofolate reductase family protein [Streptomyces coryli]